MPGPWSRTVSVPSTSRTSTVPPGGLHLIALSRTLSTARSSRERAPTNRYGLEPALEAQLRRPVLRPLDRCRHELVERERLACVDRPPVAGGLDEIADQCRELLDRPDGCAEHALALFDGQVRPRQQLDVRAVRGQRRPQLVRGVRDQLLLSLLRLVERCEHRVEVGCEARQLVPAARPGSAG